MKGGKVHNQWLASLLALGLCVSARPSEAARPSDEPNVETVWRIGSFDGSSAEFHEGQPPAPAGCQDPAR